MRTKSVLGAYALLAYLKKESGWSRVRGILASKETDVLMNSVNVGEVYYILARERGLRAGEHFLSVILPGLPIAVTENTLEEVIEAARVKANASLSFADCFAAATAVREGVPLVTGDPEFRKLGKTLKIDWIG
ncbi:MAG: hypothetical protein A2Y69_04820 [Candidatus Aminicenantes bacterium RBG_13_59_9]|nr:MAG: hypothetical protein A2Y69_04820 [Candidatus Aminicenantes bacterium RBG_13_59_9]